MEGVSRWEGKAGQWQLLGPFVGPRSVRKLQLEYVPFPRMLEAALALALRAVGVQPGFGSVVSTALSAEWALPHHLVPAKPAGRSAACDPGKRRVGISSYNLSVSFLCLPTFPEQ